MRILLPLLFLCFQGLQGQTWKALLPYGGIIRSSITTTEGMLVGTDAGIYISKDNGNTFEPWSQTMPSGFIVDLHQNGNTIFACNFDKGIYTSTDSGINWNLSLKGTFLVQDDFGVSEFVQVGSAIVVRSYYKDSLYITTNNGQDWTRQKYNNSLFEPLCAAQGHLFVYSFKTLGATDGVYRSNDLGKNWVPSNSGIVGYTNVKIWQNGNKIYAFNQHVFESVDTGRTWTRISTDTVKSISGSYPFSPEWMGFDGQYFYAQNGGNASLQVCRWTPGDPGWKLFQTGLSSQGSTLNFLSSKGKIYLSRYTGLFEYTNAWTPNPLTGLFNFKVEDISTSGQNAVAVNQAFIYSCTDANNTWLGKNPANISDLSYFYTINHSSAGMVIVGEGALGAAQTYFSTDGNSWTPKSLLDAEVASPTYFFNDSLMLYGRYTSPLVIALNASGVYGSDRSKGAFGFTFDDRMASMTSFRDTLYGLISSDDYSQSKIRRFYGGFWNLFTEKINSQFFGAKCITEWQNKLFIGYSMGKGVAYTSGSKSTWLPYSEGLSNVTPTCFLPLGDSLFMGSDKGVFLRTKSGSQWDLVQGNLPSLNVSKLVATKQYIWVLLENGGVWRMARAGFTGVKEMEAQALEIYPNPAEHKFTIQVPNDTKIAEVKLLNLSGQICETYQLSGGAKQELVSELPPGVYQITAYCEKGVKYSGKLIIR